ncbi:MAG: glucose-1-phosphate adenylyltransferase subunit GlgD [Lachnospiraceae bacterium]|nr:glucose-1-phosphate adenylyltransferase subunit GlgD [Lachnospiraceae bacterium]
MVNVKTDALGILFPNVYDSLVPQLTSERVMASIPFASRYRMIDFVLSSFVNSDIDDVSIVVRENYFSLLDHVGSGREWDLSQSTGGLKLYPPYSEKGLEVYSGRVDAVYALAHTLSKKKKKYVIMADTNIATSYDFKDMLKKHIENGADITVAYIEQKLPEGLRNQKMIDKKTTWYTYDLDENNFVKKIKVCEQDDGVKNMGTNVFICDREWLIETAAQAYIDDKTFFERDVVSPILDQLKVYAYKHENYTVRISDMQTFFDQSMALLKDDNMDKLLNGRTVFTKTNDDNPTRYVKGSRVKNSMIADGCIIEGTVENCIIHRKCHIKKGAVVRNSIIFSHGIIEEGARLDYVIADKRLHITQGKEMKGSDSFPNFIPKGSTI